MQILWLQLLQVYVQNIDNSILQPYIEDNYLKTIQILSTTDTNYINFSTNQNIALSKATDRFKIVFKAIGSLPGSITTIQATTIKPIIVIDWTAFSNVGVEKFEVLKSRDGIHFSSIGHKLVNNSITNVNYQFIDESPIYGLNYYQIKTIGLGGIQQLSRIATANFEEQKSTIKIYPNPIKGKQFKIQLESFSTGQYTLSIYTPNGKLIENQTVQHQESQKIHQISLNSILSSGMYILRIDNDKTKLTEKIIVEN